MAPKPEIRLFEVLEVRNQKSTIIACLVCVNQNTIILYLPAHDLPKFSRPHILSLGSRLMTCHNKDGI